MNQKLFTEAIVKFLAGVLLVGLLIFLPAGTLSFSNGWLLMAILFNALTLLGVGSECRDQSKQWRAEFRLSPEQKRRGTDLLKAASLLLYAFPGSPTVYYGDEAGMEGFEDPFNRRTYPWGKEDAELLDWYKALGRLRHEHSALRAGSIRYVAGEHNLLSFIRADEEEEVLVCFNPSEEEQQLTLDVFAELQPMLGSTNVTATEGEVSIILPPRSGSAFLVQKIEE